MSFREYYQFNRREKRGILVLSILLVIIILSPKIYQLTRSSEIKNKDELLREINDFQNSLVMKESKNEYAGKLKYEQSEKSIQKKEYDFKDIDSININESTVKDWMNLNFTKKQAKVIVNYIDKVKPVNSIDELLKIYVIDKDKLNQIKPFVYILSEKETELVIEPVKLEKIDLNIADSLQLVSVGIPDYIASRIIKYRDLLGGFYSLEQLNEVFGIQNNQIELLSSQSLDTSRIKKINLNHSDFKTINKHPYMSYEFTKNVFNYLKIMDKIKSCDDLVKNKIVSSEELIKMKPYITLED